MWIATAVERTTRSVNTKRALAPTGRSLRQEILAHAWFCAIPGYKSDLIRNSEGQGHDPLIPPYRR